MINPDFNLKNIPNRPSKPRNNGLTMVMDKGLSCRQAEDFLEVAADKTDIIKLGFGTSTVTPSLSRKLEIYQEADIPVYFGGTLFEAYVIRNQFDDYKRLLDKYKITHAEVSDGSMEISEDQKCEYISSLAKDFTVLSEVGSKDAEKIIPPYKWIAMMKAEIAAGAWKVIAEARESGTVGIFRNSGEIRSGLIEEILQHIPLDTILWEAPQKVQQVWFLTLYGHNVNLGNIAPHELIPLETLRLGLRGDTFSHWL
ncbi:phosphosulfolactate synthase [Bacteroidia bacterium]|jgi:phosphosulfolactate synthase|nr:phosphosulfolactate synthase [Bacteroidia bacterium]MDC0468258.1 phosphosulfolactate synthase [Bacteroidia bacterium]MDC0561468.1 phosphosulfolactate synthase [Bacteroidia bacterium]MDC3406353.1 phosphosulfolactate synthase [Bacteroidia bacterium]CAI8198400.1 MAG: Phosphosulfolactate synthase [Bacteroidia bacterium]